MILRRLTQSLKEQNWTAITIEFVLLVVGVFLGIQVGNWNQERASRQQGEVLAARLRTDLQVEHWRYQYLLSYSRQVLANAQRAVATLEGRSPLSDEALLVSAYRATQYKESPRSRATFDELISTGSIGLVRDRELRDTAMRLYGIATFDNLVHEGLQSKYREAFRMSLPNDVQGALAARCGDRYIAQLDYAGIPGVLDYACRTQLPEATLAASVQALRANPLVLHALRLRIADLQTRLGDMTGNNRDIWASLERIGGPRVPRPGP